MKKSILTSLTALAISTAQAGFIIKIPLEQAQGGHLPNGSIKLAPINSQNWCPNGSYEGFSTVNDQVYGICTDGVFVGATNYGDSAEGRCDGGNIVGTVVGPGDPFSFACE
ncbi:hypothetical protein [Pseudomonas reactans]